MNIDFSFEIEAITAVIIVIATISQAIFGIGILLFGTPALIFVGVQFSDALLIVLPISITISIIQVMSSIRDVNTDVLARFLRFSLPGVLVGLPMVLFLNPSFNLLIGGILIANSVTKIDKVKTILRRLVVDWDRTYMFIMGLIHGISNLGGPLLVFRLSLLKLEKIQFRSSIAITYLIFATFQLAIVWISVGILTISLAYILLALLTYSISNRWIFVNIQEGYYREALDYFILATGVALCFKGIFTS